MRGITAAGVLMTVLLAGCASGAEPAGQASSPPGAVVSPPASPAAVAAPHSLVLSAEGDAGIISIVYEIDGVEGAEGSVSLPWRTVVEVPADGRQHRWKLTVKHGSGRAELIAIFDGTVTGRTQGAGTGEGTLSVGGSVRG